MQISKNEYLRLKEKERQLEHLALTFDGLGFIVKAYDYDAEKIGKHFLEVYYQNRRDQKHN